mmetsp:Transcript_94498/g.267442  ORF Transcript_94498/g.267442 Transcript_94498/m.267442 type:complete len:217 (+) Transcript_94498:1365-2015(+)
MPCRDVPAATSGVVVARGPIFFPLAGAVGVEGSCNSRSPNHGDRLHSVGQGQDALVVLEHDNGFRRQAAREGRMRRARHVPHEPALAPGGGALRGAGEVHPVHHREYPRHRAVHRAARARQVLGGVVDLLPRPGHLLVQALRHAEGVRRPPVRLDEPPEPHLLPQDLLKVLLIRTGVLSIYPVVGTHNRRDTCINRGLKWRIIQFPRGPVINLGRL